MTAFYQQLLTAHRQTEDRLAELQGLLKRPTPDIGAVQSAFQHLKAELDAHFACEEHALFPVLNQYRTMMLMEVEHNNLLSAIIRFEEALLQSTACPHGDLLPAFQNLDDMLKAHIREEESGVFPQADRCFEPEEKALVQRKLKETADAIAQGVPMASHLHRPQPGYTIADGKLLQPPQKPIAYDKVFDREHAALYQVQLQAGQQLKTHMSGEHQAILVVHGAVQLTLPRQTETLGAGQLITLDPQLPYGVQAIEPTTLIICKVWPKPHFLRV